MTLIPVFERTPVGVAACRRGTENDFAATVRGVVLALTLFAVRVADVVRVPDQMIQEVNINGQAN